ncbi:ribonuclease Z 1 [Echria macrotheca]|uniref:ribonuclease Z n=1 Tax=Echria macrotheca TaxID=438768 RepID=A0AAJ0BFP5_9PEZI|nr:ribonuclease Z 1 [Echria macrotheca]
MRKPWLPKQVSARLTKGQAEKPLWRLNLRDSSRLIVPQTLFPNHHVFPADKHRIPPVYLPPAAQHFRYLLARRPRPVAPSTQPRVLYDGNMLVSVQVFSTPTADTPGALLVLTFGDGSRFLLGNVAEGTQRAMVQRKQGMSRISNIFITGPISWHSTGGLLGMMLTVADTVKASRADADEQNRKRAERGAKVKGTKDSAAPLGLQVHGGRNLTHTIAAARSFVFRTGMPMIPHETDGSNPRDGSKPDFVDDHVLIWKVPLLAPVSESLEVSEFDRRLREGVVHAMFGSDWKLDTLREVLLHDVKLPAKIFHRNEQGKLEQYTGPTPDKDPECPNIPVLVRDPWPATQADKLPDTVPSGDSMCYIVKTHPRRGRFRADAARSYGIKPSDNSKLVAGQSLVGKDGVLVTPDMVLEPSIPGCGFAVVDIPTTDLIDAFLSRPEWADAEIMDNIHGIYWILGEDVHSDPRIVEWIKTRSQLKHYLLGRDTSPNRIALESPAFYAIQMQQIDPDRFNIPVHSNDAQTQPPPAGLVPQLGATLQLVPEVREQTSGLVPLMDTRIPIQKLIHEKTILELAAEARAKISDPAFRAQVEAAEANKPTEGVEVISLGTGSAIPSKYRNVSATLIRTPQYGSYLLDCGENTLGQLRRRYGFAGADEILKDLRAVCISHSHADHHLGTASVLSRRLSLLTQSPNGLNPIALVGCSSFATWFEDYNMVEDMGGSRHVKLIVYRDFRRTTPWRTIREAEIGTVELPNIEAVGVDHCRNAMALVLTFPNGLKIAYSGDCRPSVDFARVGRGAHLLVHEATFDSELQGEALAKKHCTVAEALEVGRQMEADKILLTHFSQRYPKLPVLQEMDDGKQTVLFAFDLMGVKLREFRFAAAFLEAWRALFNEEAGKKEEEEEEAEEEMDVDGDLGEPAKKKCKKEKKEKGKKED